MAIRQEELLASEAIVYPFPTNMMVARRARRAMMARRRRTFAVATVGLATVLLMTAGPQGSAQASRTASPRVVTVAPGTTLWDLAERFAPGSVDPRAYVQAVVALNELHGPLQPGVRLELP